MQSVVDQLHTVSGDHGAAVAAKLDSVLYKNPGFSTLNAIAAALSGKPVTGETLSMVQQRLPTQIASFKFAPVTSCDAERSFSALKRVLADRRRRLSPEHLKRC